MYEHDREAAERASARDKDAYPVLLLAGAEDDHPGERHIVRGID
ncbi:hypothetical protein [Streptomyces omiyaensis]|uniref:Uncharacterized protein n=1 Tax=Streptomyces omiyaensis TaxID=68247 RepID=A0ABW7C499_9ACTN|nr:hypothetical protein [Streptomyces omiyaensis]GGY84616.1 hypothetical protein GCM10010363_76190 [Streptomyces omiyaensis]